MTTTHNEATPTCRALNHFTPLNDKAFGATEAYYASDAAAEVEAYYGYIANAIARYLATGDVSHVNKAVQGSLGAGRYRTFMRVAKNLVAHKWDKAHKKLVGKIDQTAKGKLIGKDADSGLEKFEATLKKNIASEVEHAKVKPAKSWDEDAAIVQLMKKAVENKSDLDKLLEKVTNAVKVQKAA